MTERYSSKINSLRSEDKIIKTAKLTAVIAFRLLLCPGDDIFIAGMSGALASNSSQQDVAILKSDNIELVVADEKDKNLKNIV